MAWPVDQSGRSTVPRLFAAGEVSSTGLHGANRLASNSLLECVVGAASIVEALEGLAQLPEKPDGNFHSCPPSTAHDRIIRKNPIETLRHDIQKLMWQSGGIIRNDRDMEQAIDRLESMRTQIGDVSGVSRAYQELRNMRQNAEILLRSALFRRESRGCHYNNDHPDTHNNPQDMISQRDQEQPYARPIPAADADATNARQHP